MNEKSIVNGALQTLKRFWWPRKKQVEPSQAKNDFVVVGIWKRSVKFPVMAQQQWFPHRRSKNPKEVRKNSHCSQDERHGTKTFFLLC